MPCFEGVREEAYSSPARRERGIVVAAMAVSGQHVRQGQLSLDDQGQDISGAGRGRTVVSKSKGEFWVYLKGKHITFREVRFSENGG